MPWLGSKADYRSAMPVEDPGARIAFAVVILTVVGLSSLCESLERLRYWFVLLALFAIAMIVSAIRQQRHQAHHHAEVRRAAGEWDDLLEAAEGTLSRGESLARMLRQRGYRGYFLRRWLIAHLRRTLAR